MADKPDSENGIVILGIPLGTPAFASAHATKRMEIEARLLQALPGMSDCQMAWEMLVYSGVPMANHALRTLPPSQSAVYAQPPPKGVLATLPSL